MARRPATTLFVASYSSSLRELLFEKIYAFGIANGNEIIKLSFVSKPLQGGIRASFFIERNHVSADEWK